MNSEEIVNKIVKIKMKPETIEKVAEVLWDFYNKHSKIDCEMGVIHALKLAIGNKKAKEKYNDKTKNILVDAITELDKLFEN
jgi:NifU-like protein involved in Fe-S cluster formation